MSRSRGGARAGGLLPIASIDPDQGSEIRRGVLGQDMVVVCSNEVAQ